MRAIIEKKKKVVAGLKEKIDKANVVVLADYRGISVKDLTGLRKKLFAAESEFRVIKNTLLKRAVEEAGLNDLAKHLQGPTAMLLGYKDPVGPIKALVEFTQEIEKGQIKAGVLDKTIMTTEDLVAMSKLPPKEILLARVVGGFQAPLYGFVNVLQGVLRKFVYALNAVKEQKEKGKEG